MKEQQQCEEIKAFPLGSGTNCGGIVTTLPVMSIAATVEIRNNDHDLASGVIGGESFKSRSQIPVDIKILDENLEIPTTATADSAGYDLKASIKNELIIEPDEVVLISTGISIHIKSPDYMAMLVPRSGLGHNHGIVLGNLVGIIDADYLGVVRVSLWNRGKQPYTVQPYERIAQMIFVPTFAAAFTKVTEFGETERGSGGFGHSGR